MSQLNVFRRLVRLFYPADFRADYGAELNATFAAQQREVSARGARLGVARLWGETLLGLLRTAPREHLAQLRQDVAYALRAMRRTPGFTAVAALTLAAAIGAGTAVFSVVRAVLLRPLPYAAEEHAFLLWNRWQGTPKGRWSNPELLDASERLRGVALAGFVTGDATLTGGGEPEQVAVTVATADLLAVLGVRPVHGRDLAAVDDRPGAAAVALVSDELWRRRFGASPAVLGEVLQVDGQPVEIVGVLPADLVMPDQLGARRRSALLLPLQLDAAAPRGERGSHYLQVVARLAPGTAPAAAQAEIDTLTVAFSRENPGEYDAEYGATLYPLREELVGPVRRPLLILLVAVGLVLAIACANVANLLLARGEVRSREIAVRRALGAGDARLVRQLLTESQLLALAAALVGLLLARWLIALVVATAPELPAVGAVGLDPLVLAATASIAVASALLFGSLPATQLVRGAAIEELRAGRGALGAVRPRTRAALVAAQVGIAVVLLVGAGLLLRSFSRLLAAPSGFDPRGVITASVSLPATSYPDRERAVRFFGQLLARLREAPEVAAAGAVAGLPLAGGRGDWDVYLEGETPSPQGSDRPVDWQAVTAGYLEAMGIRLVAGRPFAPTDGADTAPVVAVNEAFVRAHFAGRDPLGRAIRLSGNEQRWMTIVGVVGDVRQDALDRAAVPEVYLPYDQFRGFWAGGVLPTMTVVVRARNDTPATLAALLRREVRALDPNLPLWALDSMRQVIAASLAERRLQLVLLGGFAILAVVLAVVGTYAVLAYQVAARGRELGVRMALGAGRGAVLRLTLWQGLAPAAAGVATGLVAAAILSRWLASLLFEVRPLDPGTYVAVAAMLLVAAAVACLLPAHRATRVDPAVALRSE